MAETTKPLSEWSNGDLVDLHARLVASRTIGGTGITNADVREARQAVLERMTPAEPRKTQIVPFNDLAIGDEWENDAGRRLMKIVWTASVYLDKGNIARGDGKGERFTTDSISSLVKKIVVE